MEEEALAEEALVEHISFKSFLITRFNYIRSTALNNIFKEKLSIIGKSSFLKVMMEIQA